MRLAKLALVLGLGLLLVGSVAAQQPPRGGGGGFGGFGGFGGGLASMLGTSRQLQEELKLEKEQIDKVTAALAKVREDLRDDVAKLRDRNTSQADRTEINKKISDANNKAIGEILKAEQMKRLQQIENQQAGLAMFAKEDVQKTLKLNDDQKEKIDTIRKDLQKDLAELSPRGGRPDPDAATKRQGLQKEATANVMKVLTAAQKDAVKDLTGEPFELRNLFGGGAGAGGGGRPGGGFGGFGTPSTPGQILSANLQETLKLTAEQKKQLEEMQKELDAKLEKLLNEEQQKQFKEIKERSGRRPGGTGAPGGTGNRPNRPDR